MKVVKGISLFIVYPLFMFVLGFYGGVKLTHFFYPGNQNQGNVPAPMEHLAAADPSESAQGDVAGQDSAERENVVQDEARGKSRESEEAQDYFPYGMPEEIDGEADGLEGNESLEAAASSETLSVDTKYVLEETDVLTHSVVETTWRLPGKYVGMNREQFVEAMEIYESFPPLSEMERGFVSLEVISFSRERVVVRMNYKFVQPSASFYLAVYNNNVVVYLEDKETIYIETDIRLDALPEALQQDIMQMMWIEDQETLYDFLENYSS